MDYCFPPFIMFIVIVTGIDVSLDKSRYEDGRKEYELMTQRSEMPRYGVCWKDAMTTIQTGCKRLTDDIQGRLALAYLNCFLEFQGRKTYECDSDQAIYECTEHMQDVDRGSFTTFFTHTQNICYFLQGQVWAEATEHTIDRLSDSSSKVALKLEDANKLQGQVLKQQEESMKNQEAIMNQASNLSNIISSSSQNIHALFEDYKKTTKEQQMLMTDVFERVSKLQHLVIGEFSGFYSIVYYSLSVVVCYLLTSTPRTSNARFWLFGVMTVNMLVEQTVIKLEFLQPLLYSLGQDEEEAVYCYQRICRKISSTIGLVILGVCVYLYKDLNTLNNQLLVEIRRQNSELKHCLLGTNPGPSGMITSGSNVVSAKADSTFESGSSESGDSDWTTDEDSDKTFILHESSSNASSFFSVMTDSVVSHVTDLHTEARQLHESTPIKQLPDRVASWVKTGYYPVSPVRSQSENQVDLECPRYFLRTRKPVVYSANPVMKVESPNSFAKTIRHLEQITKKNSVLARAMIRRGTDKTN